MEDGYDKSVTIGGEECEIIDLTYNELTCLTPATTENELILTING